MGLSDIDKSGEFADTRSDQREHKEVFIHVTPKADACAHDFQGWREFDDGHGGEQVCTKCGIGAMSYTLSLGDL